MSLKSRLEVNGSSFNFDLEGALSSFLIKFFVACCSINFLTTVFFVGSGFLKVTGLVFILLSFEDLKGVFFSIEKVFFPSLAKDERSIFFVVLVEIVKVLFFFFFIFHEYFI